MLSPCSGSGTTGSLGHERKKKLVNVTNVRKKKEAKRNQHITFPLTWSLLLPSLFCYGWEREKFNLSESKSLQRKVLVFCLDVIIPKSQTFIKLSLYLLAASGFDWWTNIKEVWLEKKGWHYDKNTLPNHWTVIPCHGRTWHDMTWRTWNNLLDTQSVCIDLTLNDNPTFLDFI